MRTNLDYKTITNPRIYFDDGKIESFQFILGTFELFAKIFSHWFLPISKTWEMFGWKTIWIEWRDDNSGRWISAHLAESLFRDRSNFFITQNETYFQLIFCVLLAQFSFIAFWYYIYVLLLIIAIFKVCRQFIIHYRSKAKIYTRIVWDIISFEPSLKRPTWVSIIPDQIMKKCRQINK